MMLYTRWRQISMQAEDGVFSSSFYTTDFDGNLSLAALIDSIHTCLFSTLSLSNLTFLEMTITSN